MLLAVVDPLPMYCRGIATVLSAAGHIVEQPGEPLAWGRRDDRMMLLTLDAVSSWDLLHQLGSAGDGCPVIAVLTDDSVAAGLTAVRAGAQSVAARQMDEATLVATVDATRAGQAVVPAEVLAALIGGADPETRQLTADQQRWLRQLAAGMTVAQLADRAGYSERAMFRLLQGLYRQLGVRTRIEAVIRAQQQGWLLPTSEQPGVT
jgi:DNA-binding NarL/FixJ family response regulator